MIKYLSVPREEIADTPSHLLTFHRPFLYIILVTLGDVSSIQKHYSNVIYNILRVAMNCLVIEIYMNMISIDQFS